jgi:serine/threonine protein kinase
MHENRILHRDIKPDNIFLGSEGNIKIGDFGISRMFDTTKQYTMSMIGTPYYVSPELVQEDKYSYKSDVWAIGCILYELCFLKRAFDGKTMIKITKDIVDKHPDFNNFRYSKDL